MGTGGSRNGSHYGSKYLNGGSNIYGCYGLLKSAENKEFGIPWGAEIYYQEPEWTTWIDPVCSLILVVIIVCLTYPVVRKPMLILMQTLPEEVDEKQLKHQILDIQGVLAVHCLHVWQLDEQKIVGSIHVVVKEINKWPGILLKIEKIFRNMGISSMTI